MPSEELSGWNAENMTDGITFENGVLTAAANSDSDVIIKGNIRRYNRKQDSKSI